MTPANPSLKGSRSLVRQLGSLTAIVTVLLSAVFVAIFVTAADRLIAADARYNATQLIDNVVPFAAMAAYSTSEYSAQTALKFLDDSPWISRAKIIDNFGDELGKYENAQLLAAYPRAHEHRTIELRIGTGPLVYGVFEVEIVHRPSHFARFFLYAGIGAIVLTGLSLALLLFAVFRKRVLKPVTQLKSQLSTWQATMTDASLPQTDFGSQELNDLSATFQQTLRRNLVVNEEKSLALAQRAQLADAVDNALARAGIFLATTDEAQPIGRMTFGAAVPAATSKIIDDLTAGAGDLGAILKAHAWDVEISVASRNFHERESVLLFEATLPDSRVWTLTCVDLDERRRAVVGTESTELKKLSQEAEAARRLEAIGVLASGIAHDFNNVLAIIIGALELHERKNGTMPNVLTGALQAAKRGAQVTRRLLDASRSDASTYSAIEIGQLVAETEAQLSNLLGSSNPLQIRVETTACVMADATQLQTTLVNLSLNARDASPPQSPIELLARDATPAEVLEHRLPQGRSFAVFSIKDTGTGIPSNILSRIFEPFFTTKERGHGTGLGLSMARSFALRSQGSISIKTAEGIGTQIILLLPSQPLQPQLTASPLTTLDQSGRLNGVRILVVEDEQNLRDSLLQMFRLESGNAIGASTLDEALSQITQSESHPFDFVVSDVILPDGLGTHILDLAVTGALSSKIILMGGNFDPKVLNASQVASMEAFLRKPFTLDGIVKKIQDAM